MNILVVDDEKSGCEVLARWLSRLDLVKGAAGSPRPRVDCAYDGAEASARLSDICYDIVICDINLPGASGFEVAETALGLCADTRVVLISGREDNIGSDRTVMPGISEFYPKPVDVGRLFEFVRSVYMEKQG